MKFSVALVLLMVVMECSISEVRARHMKKRRAVENSSERNRISFDESIRGSYDFEGNLYMNCTSLSNNQESVTKCLLKTEKSMGARPLALACYTVFGQNGPTSQGCWIHQEMALSMCTLDSCVTNDKVVDELRFCCCRGHECNSRMRLADD